MLIPKRGLYVQHTCIERFFSSLAGWLGNAVWGVLQGDAGRRLLNRLSPFMVSSVEIRRRKFFFPLPSDKYDRKKRAKRLYRILLDFTLYLLLWPKSRF